MTRLNVNINESIYVGDSPSDIKYCKEVGIPIAAAAWADTTNAQELESLNPNWLFYPVSDFKTWLINHI